MLSFFNYDSLVDGGKTVKVTGFTFTSKNIFANALNSYNTHNEEGIILNADGVFHAYVILYNS